MTGVPQTTDHEYLMAKLATVINDQEEMMRAMAFLITRVEDIHHAVRPGMNRDGAASAFAHELMQRADLIRSARRRKCACARS